MCRYIGFTIEGVTPDFEIFTAFLCIRQIFGRHTAEAILSEFEDILREWNLKISVVIRVVTDSGSNMIKAFDLNLPGYVEKENESENKEPDPSPDAATNQNEAASNLEMVDLELTGPVYDSLMEMIDANCSHLSHLATGVSDLATYEMSSKLRESCKAHDLQNVIKNGLNKIEAQAGAVIKRVSKIINSVRMSVNDTEAVFKAVGFRLVAKNATRWNSQLASLRSIIKAIDYDPQLQTGLNATTKKH
ncbi:Uncharacterized protein APZ42_006142 [Daphnia magna]|uniref:Uncharacterized protein n=1 Tax=Daphnia magna TaxID=35525 RepID=A0A164G2H2_9CRUS|nr:Uncharacterized protein APZ42_006142 [Daphnia magna]